MKPLIDQSFWSDPDIESAKAGVKLTALWLITNSQTSLIGVCGASIARFKFETGLDEKALESTLQALPRAFVRIGNSIFVRNYIRHQFGRGEKLKRNNFFVALLSHVQAIADKELKSEILSEYPEFSEALQRASQGLTKPKDGKDSKDKEGTEKKRKRGAGEKVKFPIPDGETARRIAALFNRREGTLWDGKEVDALDAIGEVDSDDLSAIEIYYKAQRDRGNDGCHRRDMQTFLNNFQCELDRSRAWKTAKPKDRQSLIHPDQANIDYETSFRNNPFTSKP